MMVTTLDESDRRARKVYYCGMCGRTINPGDLHHTQTNVYDGRVYTWRDCLPCHQDEVIHYVHDWTGGYHDEGVDFEQAAEWAQETVAWPRRWWGPRGAKDRVVVTSADEQGAARRWLARAAGGEGE